MKMRVSGFTIAKNAVLYDYPLAECLRSLLPLVDELIVAVGDSDDGTWELIQALNDPKIKAFRTVWDPALRQDGLILSQQTNLALQRCSGDWAMYLQADELLHESGVEPLRAAMRKHLEDGTEGLWFDYLHFYGAFNVVQDQPLKWYSRAIRAVRTGKGLESWGDAMGFLGRDARGRLRRDLKAVSSGVTIYHYGHVRPPQVMLAKTKNLDSYYHDDAWVRGRFEDEQKKLADFYDERGNLRLFTGSHPAAMATRVAAQNWTFEHGIEKQLPRPLRMALIYLQAPFARHWNSLKKRW
jgi:glycosyltransferase involved in cell wall biosynthesis